MSVTNGTKNYSNYSLEKSDTISPSGTINSPGEGRWLTGAPRCHTFMAFCPTTHSQAPQISQHPTQKEDLPLLRGPAPHSLKGVILTKEQLQQYSMGKDVRPQKQLNGSRPSGKLSTGLCQTTQQNHISGQIKWKCNDKIHEAVAVM